jgi:hypothetical protein
MVKIRYAELPAGLHVATEADARCTIVYLKPGLTHAQRKDALTVARRSARFGHGPSLPTLDMAFALAADRTRTTGRIVASAMRKHPLLLLPLLVLILGIIAAGILASAAVGVTVPPPVPSAESGGMVPVNIGRLVPPVASHVPGPVGGGPGSGSQGAVGGRAGQPASHGGRAHHSRVRTRAHPGADLPAPAAAR